jgi:hypothetical protein
MTMTTDAEATPTNDPSDTWAAWLENLDGLMREHPTAKAIERLEAARWRLDLDVSAAAMRTIWIEAIEDLGERVDEHAQAPGLHLVCPFDRSPAGGGLDIGAARAALSAAASTKHLRIAWCSDPAGSGAPVLAVVHGLLVVELDPPELFAATTELAEYAQSLLAD